MSNYTASDTPIDRIVNSIVDNQNRHAKELLIKQKELHSLICDTMRQLSSALSVTTPGHLADYIVDTKNITGMDSSGVQMLRDDLSKLYELLFNEEQAK